jgi:uncharacterized protein (TIGR02147 family)
MIKYQETLKGYFQRRLAINPRYSLRSFARFLDMQPSKLSEVFNGKKGLSLDKARDIAKRINLAPQDKLAFELSVLSQHGRSQAQRKEALSQLQRLEVRSKAKSSMRRNAWYFGAIEALLAKGISDDEEISRRLNITKLQIENSKRFIKRIKALHPEVDSLSLEPESVVKKMVETFYEGANRIDLHTNFAFLTERNLGEIKRIIDQAIVDNQEYDDDSALYMVNFSSTLLSKE